MRVFEGEVKTSKEYDRKVFFLASWETVRRPTGT